MVPGAKVHQIPEIPEHLGCFPVPRALTYLGSQGTQGSVSLNQTTIQRVVARQPVTRDSCDLISPVVEPRIRFLLPRLKTFDPSDLTLIDRAALQTLQKYAQRSVLSRGKDTGFPD